PRNHTRGGGYFDSYMDRRASTGAIMTPTTGSLSANKESVEMTASSSVDSCATVTPDKASPANGPEPPSVLVTEESTEGSSESESNSSVSSSSIIISRDGAFLNDALNEQARPLRFNSYPMDRSHLSTTSSSPAATPATTTSPASLTVPQPSWLNSPQGSMSSMTSTPSFTSASSPSQSPSSPSELSDSVKSIQQVAGGQAGVNSFDYNTFLQRDGADRHGVSNAYGSTHHRHSLSESTLDGHLPWDSVPAANAKEVDTVNVHDGWSDESGHTTPTRSSTPRGSGLAEPIDFGKRTPRAGSPAIFGENTPRQAEF
ncbi:6209_t:CDS:2, partial [Acaulospora colombiana]